MTTGNPFPGPQPYRAAERDRFFGRDEAILRLSDSVLSHRILTLYGPSGAGKSSLLQAGVIPHLQDEWDARTVVVDSWPPEAVVESGPLGRLKDALTHDLGLGTNLPEDLADVIRLAFRRSDRPVVLVLDQLEQLVAFHEIEVLEAFVDALETLSFVRGVALHVVMALREDYLGRWTALLGRVASLVRHTTRLKRLTSREMSAAVMQSVASGEPAQAWEPAPLREMVDQMAVPGQWQADEPEVESAYVQIVCRTLWSMGGLRAARSHSPDRILQHYLETTLNSLGKHKAAARRLLENRLITKDGTRVPVTRAAAIEELGEGPHVDLILDTLEQARILYGQSHRGRRFYELGHDWLAQPIRESAMRRRAAVAQRQARRRMGVIGVIGLGLVMLLGMAVFAAIAFQDTAEEARLAAQRAEAEAAAATRARTKAEKAEQFADAKASEALQEKGRADEEALKAAEAAQKALDEAESARLAEDKAKAAEKGARLAQLDAESARDLASTSAQHAQNLLRMTAAKDVAHDPTRMAPLVAGVTDASNLRSWRAAAYRVLQAPLAAAVLAVSDGRITHVAGLPDGSGVVGATSKGEILLWSRAALGSPTVLASAKVPIELLQISPDGRWVAWATTTQDLGWAPMDGSGAGGSGPARGSGLTALAIDGGGERLVAATELGSIWAWAVHSEAKPKKIWAPLRATGVWSLDFGDDPSRFVAALEDNRLLHLGVDGSVLGGVGLDGAVFEVRVVPGVGIVAGTAGGTLVQRDVSASGQGARDLLSREPCFVRHLDVSRDAQRIAALCDTGVVWVGGLGQKGGMLALPGGAEGTATRIAFVHDSKHLAVGHSSGQIDLWTLNKGHHPVDHSVLEGHEGHVTGLTDLPGSGHFAAVSAGGQTRIWPVVVPSLSKTLKAAGRPWVKTVGLSEDASLAQIEFADGTRRTVRTDDLQGGPETPLALDGNSSSGLDLDRSDIVWFLRGENEVQLIEHRAKVIQAVARKDARGDSVLVSLDASHEVRLWRLPGSQEDLRALLEAHGGAVCPDPRIQTLYFGADQTQATNDQAACHDGRRL